MSKPLIIDSAEFARERNSLAGEIELRRLTRVLDGVQSQDGTIRYELHGSVDRFERPTLRLKVAGSVELLCQRCLKPVSFVIDNDSRLTLFGNEAEIEAAAEQDDELDGIVAQHEQAVIDLIEDEILLALPLAPKHDVCASEGKADSAGGKPNPFAVLQQLKANKQADPD